jgi:hypothetical protein
LIFVFKLEMVIGSIFSGKSFGPRIPVKFNMRCRRMPMHLKQVCIFPQKFPIHDRYPFNLHIFSHPRTVDVHCPVTFFVGENGTGKSTLLQAISHRCGIYIWRGERRARFRYNPYETEFYKAIEVEWVSGPKIPFQALFLPLKFLKTLPKSWMNGRAWIPDYLNILAANH